MRSVIADSGVYYLTYIARKNPRRCRVGIKYPGVDATPLIILGGRRAKKIIDFIMQLLEKHGLEHSIIQEGKQKLVELPWATGLATTIYLLTVYSSLKPLRYSSILEMMITGNMPFMKYLVALTELAIPLSNYFEKREMTGVHHANRMVDDKAARVISKMLIELVKKTGNAVE